MPIDDAYLDRALDELLVVGVALGSLAWHSWFPEEREAAAAMLNSESYELLKDERFSACLKLCEVGLTLEGPGWVQQAQRVNGWIARKQRDGRQAIESEVRAWDVSALANEFTLAHHALLDELDVAFELIPGLLETDALDYERLADWPLFRELRQDPRYEEVAASAPSRDGEDPDPSSEPPTLSLVQNRANEPVSPETDSAAPPVRDS